MLRRTKTPLVSRSRRSFSVVLSASQIAIVCLPWRLGRVADLFHDEDGGEGSFPHQVVEHLAGAAVIVARLSRLVKGGVLFVELASSAGAGAARWKWRQQSCVKGLIL